MSVPDSILIAKFKGTGGKLTSRPLFRQGARMVDTAGFSPAARHYNGDDGADDSDICARCLGYITTKKVYLGDNFKKPYCMTCAAMLTRNGRLQDTSDPHTRNLVQDSAEGLIIKVGPAGRIWCYQCRMYSDNEAHAEYHKFSGNLEAKKQELIVGNLTEDEYRFFVGSPRIDDTWSKCRCCGKELFSRQERKEHRNSSRNTDGKAWAYNCNEKLVGAFKELRAKGKCIVCKTPVVKEHRWGIPMHNTCVREWKFRRDPYVPLALAVKQFEAGIK